MNSTTPFTDEALEHERGIAARARERHERGEALDDLEWGRVLGLEKWLATVDALRTEVTRLREALHDAQAIGDFATELRDRLALKENAAACAKLAAETVSERDALRVERDDALLSAMGHAADADRLTQQVEELGRVLDRAAEAGRVSTKRLLEITATLDQHYLNAPERKELEDAIHERDWLVDQLDLANEHVQASEMRSAVMMAELKDLREGRAPTSEVSASSGDGGAGREAKALTPPAKAEDAFHAPITAAPATLAEEDADAAETLNDGDRIACPWCGKFMRDLWEYHRNRGEEDVAIECGFCDKPMLLSIHQDVSYSARRVVSAGDDGDTKVS